MKTFLISVKEMSNEMEEQLLKYGTVEVVVSKLAKIYAIKTDPKNKYAIRKIRGVISVEENSFGSFDI